VEEKMAEVAELETISWPATDIVSNYNQPQVMVWCVARERVNEQNRLWGVASGRIELMAENILM
jgi:hypothetical protein